MNRWFCLSRWQWPVNIELEDRTRLIEYSSRTLAHPSWWHSFNFKNNNNLMEHLVYLIQAVLLAAFVLYLVWQYSDKHVPCYVKLLTFVSWLLTFSAFIILPIDIANSYREEDESLMSNTRNFLNILWRVLYWFNFLLSWFILPICQDYEDSGEFNSKMRLKYSLRKNVVIYAAGLVIGIVFIVYLSYSRNLSLDAIGGVLAGLGNLVGIMLIIMLLGYGFIAIPRAYIQECNQELELIGCYSNAVEVEEYKLEKLYDLEEKCRVLYTLIKLGQAPELETFLKQILNNIPEEFQENIKRSMPTGEQSKLVEPFLPLNMEKIATLNREVKRLLFDLRRADTKFAIIGQHAFRLEQLSQLGKADSAFASPSSGTFLVRTYTSILNIWALRVRKPLMKYIGYVFALMSLILLCGELSIFTEIPINAIKLFLKLDTGFYSTQVSLFPFLLYIACCTYYGLFHLKVAGLFAFNPHHQTDAPSLMFGSVYEYITILSNFGRVSFPLCYNFIQLTQTNIETAFSDVIGDMNVVPIFGPSFTVLLPLMLILMCFFNLFNLGGKLMGAVGLSSYAGREEIEGRSDEGKRILTREREAMSRGKDSRSTQELAVPNSWARDNPQDRRDSQRNQYVRNFNDILSI